MELVKKTDDYQIFKKRNGRYSVKKANKYLNGDDKAAILAKEGLIKLSTKAETPAAEEATEESAE